MYLYVQSRITALLVLAPILAVHSFVEYGVVTPFDPFLFVGEPLRLFCNITNPDVREDSSSLFFEKGDERRASQILNTRAIRLTVPEVELGDDGSYVCLLQTLEGKVEILGHQKVKVDIAPREVVNVKCRVYNWESLTCTWDLGVHYNHPKHVNVSVFWVATDVQQDCPQLTSSSCHWNQKHYSHGLRYNILIVVTYRVKGHIRKKASKMIKINSDEVVEPAPVEKLKALPSNSTCITLVWHTPRVFMRPMRFLQQMKPSNGNWSNIHIVPSSHSHEHNSSHESVVCDLDPDTGYEFRVAVLPVLPHNGQQVGYESEWRTIFASTEEDVPSAPPVTCPGCYFDVANTHLDPEMTRTVRVMWKDIPKSLRQGKLTHYRISYFSINSNYNSSITRQVTDREKHVTSAILHLPSKHEDYTIRITGATAKGESIKGSYILIPSVENKPQPPQRFLVKRNRDELGSTRLYLSWAALADKERSGPSSSHHRHIRSERTQDLEGVYIFWCQGSRATWQCQSELEWVKLPPDQVTYELVTGMKQLDPYNLLIGISVQEIFGKSVISSGIQWSQCIFTRNQKPETAPLNVRFQPTSAGDDSLIVIWEKRGCREETSYVTEFLVRYCPSSPSNKCIGDRITLNVSSDVTRVTLPHLARSTKYLVHVVAASSAGLGPPSEDIWHMIEPEPPDEDISGLIAVVLTIISVVFLLTGCFCFIRYCYRQRQKIPSVNGLLDVQPTQKCPPVNHYRGRPLPAPPEDVFVDHHTYGTSSDRTCMNNLGCDKSITNPVSDDCAQESISSNIPLLADNTSKNIQLRRDGEVPLSASKKTNFPKPCDREDSHDRDSILTTSNYIQRKSSSSPVSNKGSYQRVALDGSAESCNTETPAAYSFIAPRPISQQCSESVIQNFSSKDTLPLRSHWSVIPEAFPMHTINRQSMGQNFIHIADIPSKTDYGKSEEKNYSSQAMVVPAYFGATLPHHHSLMGSHPPQPLNVAAVDDQEFCTCGSDSEDANSVDMNDNVSPSSKAIVFPLFERRRSIPIDSIFSTISPPSGPPSPTPPYDNAPPLPTESESRFPMNPRRERFAPPVALGSQEYLEPQVFPSSYVSSGVS